MATSAKVGFGVKLKRGDGGGPEVFTDVAELTNVEWSGITRETIDVSNMDTAGWREFLSSGLKDPGEVTAEFNWVGSNAQQTGLRSDCENGTARNFKIVWPQSPNVTASFTAYVTTINYASPIDGAMTGSVTLKVTGAITWS